MSEQFEQESIPKVNNNPFLPEGRIHKMSFFLTTLVLSLIASCFYGVTEAGVVSEDAMVFETAVSASLGTVLLQIFACIKRCRDVLKALRGAYFFCLFRSSVLFTVLFCCLKVPAIRIKPAEINQPADQLPIFGFIFLTKPA
ncbi:hypothetical protein [uncultured Parasutterella sp.]|uniref:hypothetical protein n=1 Tax=uncultured Parasutterella sp. TaxID=1263098 RepID=UPI0025959054|nr:hypothetical protein [uncultured Parasutterella sp.]